MEYAYHRLPLAFDIGIPDGLSRLKLSGIDTCLVYETERETGETIEVTIRFHHAIHFSYTEQYYLDPTTLMPEGYDIIPPAQGELLIEIEGSEFVKSLEENHAKLFKHETERIFRKHKLYKIGFWDEGWHEIVAESFSVEQKPLP